MPRIIPEASSDGGGSTIDLSSLEWEYANLTPGNGYSLFDPDNLIDSVTFNPTTKVNRIIWNAVSPGSSAYNIGTNSGGHRMPRWHRPLTVSGASVDHNDSVIVHLRLEYDGVSNDYNQRSAWGICNEHDSTVPDDLAGSGLSFEKNVAGSASLIRPTYGGWSHDTITSASNSGQEYSIGYHLRVPGGTGDVTFHTYDEVSGGDDIYKGSGRRLGHNTTAQTGDMSLIFIAGTKSNSDTIAAGNATGFKLAHLAIKVPT